MTAFDAWRSKTDESLDVLLHKCNDDMVRLHRLAATSHGSTGSARPSASSAKRPSRPRLHHNQQDVGGGILGPHLPHPVTGTSMPPQAIRLVVLGNAGVAPPRSSPMPKLEFPKFNDKNPLLCKDRCELYFEVYGEAVETRCGLIG